MPELPEAEYMVRRLEKTPGAGLQIVKARVLRPSLVAPQTPAAIARQLQGRKILGYARRAKNVLIHLEDNWSVRIQLGMTGHVYGGQDPCNLSRFARVVLEVSDQSALVFEDARTFGSFHVHRSSDLAEVFADYGPEPLDEAWSWQMLRESAARAKGPVKPFLLDQSRVVGLGNIWAAEALWEARISPFRLLPTLTDREWKRLHTAIRQVLTEAIAATFRVTARPEEFPEADLLSCRVYGREGEKCRRCRRSLVQRETQAGRSTFFCGQCQKLLPD